jgi:hypothetical protein
MSEDKDKEEEKGFIFQDRRSSHLSDEENKEQEKKTQGEVEKEKQKDAARIKEKEEAAQAEAEINFSTFVLSLTSSAFYYLGDIPDPMTGQTQENLPAVKQTIDILIMLQDKTKNNLNTEEAKLIEQLIYELQMKFIAKQQKQ